MAKRERFRRHERTAEDMRRKASEGSRDYDQLFVGDVKLFRPDDGENCIRIMPATFGLQPYTNEELDKMSDEELEKLQAEEDLYGSGWDLPIYVHYQVGPDEGSYLCRDKMLGERCPVCEAKAAARDPDEADELSPTKRALTWIIDRNAEKEGPQLWSMPWSKIRNEIYGRSVDKKHGTPIMIDDVDEGFDITFNKSGSKDRTQYTSVEIDRDPTPLHDDEKKQDRWLDYIMEHRLPDVLNFFDPEHIEKVLTGRKSSRRGDDEQDEGEGSSRGRSRRGGGRSGRDRSGGEEEERDYRDEPDEEQESAEGRSSRSRRRSGSRDREDEGGDDEPARGTSRRRRSEPEPAEEPDPEPDDEGGEGSPTEQARERLGGLRSRRSRR